MGTRSTVKFYRDTEPILCLYQQYDGYLAGVGVQVAEHLVNYGLVKGREGKKVAYDFDDWALLYVLEYKKEPGLVYATDADDSQEYDYIVTYLKPNKITVEVRSRYGKEKVFFGTGDEYVEFIEKNTGKIQGGI